MARPSLTPAELIGLPKVCDCKRGYRSAYDGKCGHCRSTKQQKTHQFKLYHGLYDKGK